MTCHKRRVVVNRHDICGNCLDPVVVRLHLGVLTLEGQDILVENIDMF